MSMKRYQMICPGSLFRAQIYFKNVALPEDIWAEGALCRDPAGNFIIINRKAGEGAYSMDTVYIETLGLSSGFSDGNKKDIFEGDILKIVSFRPGNDVSDAQEDVSELNENDYFSMLGIDSPDAASSEDGDEYVRRVYSDVPSGAETVSLLEGVVFMNGGVFFIQYYDASTGMLNAVPLWQFFGFDMLPGENYAVKVIGNLYDNEELYAKVLALS